MFAYVGLPQNLKDLKDLADGSSAWAWGAFLKSEGLWLSAEDGVSLRVARRQSGRIASQARPSCPLCYSHA